MVLTQLDMLLQDFGTPFPILLGELLVWKNLDVFLISIVS